MSSPEVYNLVYWTDDDRQSDDELPCKNFFLSTGK